MSTVYDAHGRPEPPMDAGEVGTLVGFLEFQRATLAWKCAGLDADALRMPLKPSSMTLGGMITHLAWVEDYWFTCVLLDRPTPPLWDEVDWDADPDWDWRIAEVTVPADLHTWWGQAKDRSRAAVTEAIAAGGMDFRARRALRDGSRPSLRWVLVHMIEEYARHNGHGDLLREAIDGLTGE